MSDHPGDTASKRFSAFWLGMGGIFLFGILTWLIWLFSNTDEVISATEQEVIDGATVYRLPVYEALLGRDVEAYVELLKRVAAIKRQTAPDLVHANLFGPSIVMHLETGKAAPVQLHK